jgi:hypothetical protein
MLLLSLFVFLFTPPAQASNCEAKITSVLTSARSAVVTNFEKGSPCFNAATVGRTQGLPGCYPPEAFQLVNLLKPYLNSAQAICENICLQEGLETQCLSITDQNELKQLGIDGILDIIKKEQILK